MTCKMLPEIFTACLALANKKILQFFVVATCTRHGIH